MNDEQKHKEDLEAAKGWLAIAKENNNKIAIQILEKFFPELRESDDERIRKELIKIFSNREKYLIDQSFGDITVSEVLAWLEKQAEQNKWKPSKDEMDALYGLAYITGKMDDKKDEAVIKLYQDLKREFFNEASFENMFPSSTTVEKQGEQNPTDKVAPKFKVGDWVVQGSNILQIQGVGDKYYCFETVGGYVGDMLVSELDSLYHLWAIQDAVE